MASYAVFIAVGLLLALVPASQRIGGEFNV